MRVRALLVFVVGALAPVATGCYHDKYDVLGETKERYTLPPDEARYNLPETATYRAKPAEKKQETLSTRGRGGVTGGGPGGPGGF